MVIIFYGLLLVMGYTLGIYMTDMECLGMTAVTASNFAGHRDFSRSVIVPLDLMLFGPSISPLLSLLLSPPHGRPTGRQTCHVLNASRESPGRRIRCIGVHKAAVSIVAAFASGPRVPSESNEMH